MWSTVGLLIFCVIGYLITVILLAKRGRIEFTWLWIIPVICVIVLAECGVFITKPSSSEAIRYNTKVVNQTIYFQQYERAWRHDRDGTYQVIYIPQHYYFESGWLDKYVLCDKPMTIVVPKETYLFIEDSMPQKKEPFIIEGAVECK